jgi:serine/threonine-protein kinase HipA
MRNGDAHLKNFGLIYDNINNATLAPTYDMLSMSVYAPALANDNDADDGLAINFEGSKRWLTPKTIKALATQCLINSKQLKEWEIQVADALVQTSKKVIEFFKPTP